MPERRVRPIVNGTVIDHIKDGNALRVLKILGITGPPLESTVSVIMHVQSNRGGVKDLLKLEDKELKKEQVDKIALICPDATINIIRDEAVVEKHHVTLPDSVKGIVRCSNIGCITNKVNPVSGLHEPVVPEFKVVSKDPVQLKCVYCDKFVEEIEKNLL